MTDADVARAFSALDGDLEAPMSIVTVQAGRDRAGCLVGFSTQTSINPPRFLVCLSRRNHTYNVVMRHRARVLAVHFLGEEDHELAELFGGQTGEPVAAHHAGAGRRILTLQDVGDIEVGHEP